MPPTTTSTAMAAVRDAQSARAAAEVAELKSVVGWAVEYRVELGVVTEATFGVDGVLLGGRGCPLVSEFDVYDLAATLGMTSESGCAFVGKTLELRYRLRRTWERVVALEVPKYKAFRVAELTMNLAWDAASYIDQMLAPVLHSCTWAQIDRPISMGIDLHDPEEAERRRRNDADQRKFDIHLNGYGALASEGTASTIAVEGHLALEDALDLDQAVKSGAKALADLGCEISLDARRAMAVGEMARVQLALDLTADGDLQAGTGRGVTIYAHLDAESLHGSLDNPGCGDVLIDQIRSWCETVGNVVSVRPVIDLNADLSTGAYAPTETIVEHVRLRDQCCVFPHCTQRARYCDVDHLEPYDLKNPRAGGKTATKNLALLCRKHHRANTFSRWTYESPAPGVYEWTSPSGTRLRVVRGRRHGRTPITTLLHEP